MIDQFIISDKVCKRPNSNTNHFIPHPDNKDFWNNFYYYLRNVKEFTHPLGDNAIKINPFFGYFGFRFHPITFSPNYFHIGIDFDQQINKSVFAVADGFFEYSGKGTQNGNYIMLSHPDIKTKDGYTMHSLYLHLNRYYIKFNFFQKILREIGWFNMASIKIHKNQIIGLTGDSGNSKNIYPHLHFQVEFRNKFSKNIILIDPTSILGIPNFENKSKNIDNIETFKIFLEQYKSSLLNFLPIIKKHEFDNIEASTKQHKK